MIQKFQDFFDATQPYREQFGTLAGLRLALSLRDWKRPRGELYDVRVPGLPYPVALRAGTSDARVLRQIFVEEELDFRLDGEPRLIVDAGANIGLSSIYLAKRFPTATIVALEIDTRNFAILNRNVRPYPSILPRCVGLWSGRARLKVANPGAEFWSFRAVTTHAGDPLAIEAVGVADLIATFGPIDLLKMDIEGGEVEVLSDDGLDWVDQVQTLAVETHDRFRPGCRAALDRAVDGRGFHESRHGEYAVFQRLTTPVEPGSDPEDVSLLTLAGSCR
jgi:FkbM family methyltransferase